MSDLPTVIRENTDLEQTGVDKDEKENREEMIDEIRLVARDRLNDDRSSRARCMTFRDGGFEPGRGWNFEDVKHDVQ